MEKKMIRYDYQEIEVKKHHKWLYMDYYPCFGWELLEVMPSEKRNRNIHLSFKRNYDVREKEKLVHYQSKFDYCMEEIGNIEIAKIFTAVLCAIAIGIIGIAFSLAACFLVREGTSLGILLLIPGMIAFLLAYPCYLVVAKEKKKQMDPFVKKRYDELFQIGETARKIMEQS
jgi:hypothetical protein